MTSEVWEGIRYFQSKEFDDPSKPGSGLRMNLAFIAELDALRNSVGIPLVINSGFRTSERNAAVGGVDDSAHTRGLAADIKCLDSGTRSKIVTNWIRSNPRVLRIGIYPTFIHIDVDPSLPNPRIWVA